MIIAVDFDGTIVTHEYPEIGEDIGAIPVLRKLLEAGHKLILYTMRSGMYLEQAVEYLTSRDIVLWGVNENPEQSSWTTSPKIYANIYIDDAALGIPLKRKSFLSKQYVDWEETDRQLYIMDLFNNGHSSDNKKESV